jgi:hypothetical protein
MSLGQNDRSRGRQTNRGREPNPLTRSMTRTALTSGFVAVRCMWLKDTFNWRATLTLAATLSPRRTIFSTPNTISD